MAAGPGPIIAGNTGPDARCPFTMLQTTLCYIEDDGRYLLLHRTKKEQDLNAGKWIGLGGKFLPGESPEECLLREVGEETGLQLTHYRYRGLVTFAAEDWCEYMHLFTATGFTGQLATTCREGHLAWVDKATLPQLPIWEGDRVFLRLLAQDRPFFSLKLTYRGEHLTAVALDGRPLPPPWY